MGEFARYFITWFTGFLAGVSITLGTVAMGLGREPKKTQGCQIINHPVLLIVDRKPTALWLPGCAP